MTKATDERTPETSVSIDADCSTAIGPSNAVIVGFEDTMYALKELRDLLECGGWCVDEMNQVIDDLYEVQTHLKKQGDQS